MINFSLKDKVAVITGGAGIICSTIGREMAEMGVKVALLDMAEDKAKEIAEEINAAGGEAIGVKVNVLEKASIQEACDIVMKRFGRVDILINGAGGNKPAATTSSELSFFDLPEDALQWVLNLNLLGSVYPSQVFGRIMVSQDSGSIVNISSMAAYTPLTNTIAYSAAKAAISNFTQWLATHMNQNYSKKIRVNAIAPGFLLTQQNYYLLCKEDGSPTERGQKVLNRTPMGRYGEPVELVGGIVYLCSDAASFVNGIVLPIDGGFLAYSGV
ncbi:MAG: SDR family oxidoreductase [Clostridiaceae bacterium]|nr:SDR family oxidoreductase [Clostridiaceae bacterium]